MINKDIPEEIKNFYPPDYDLDGSEVLEIIKEMPERYTLPLNRESNSSEIYSQEIRRKRNPEREVPPLGEEAIKVLYYAVQEMYKIFENIKGDYSIPKYNVLISLHINHDIEVVSFCPKVETFIQGVPFEIPYKGMWQNGPGVSFYYSLSNHVLIKKIYMR